jgi:hypothetical protein
MSSAGGDGKQTVFLFTDSQVRDACVCVCVCVCVYVYIYLCTNLDNFSADVKNLFRPPYVCICICIYIYIYIAQTFVHV